MDYLLTVKQALNITGTYQDNTLNAWINETVAFLVDAGVSQDHITPGIMELETANSPRISCRGRHRSVSNEEVNDDQ